ncbi:hypothetical protein VTJ49DRAFT_5816 [Mycothermus thermophilus]|uniref:BHLH domain-containing protein n=1 Tax=Humicola insolens TaxID=85995 RepID=A0ABR3VQ72_HUMIN
MSRFGDSPEPFDGDQEHVSSELFDEDQSDEVEEDGSSGTTTARPLSRASFRSGISSQQQNYGDEDESRVADLQSLTALAARLFPNLPASITQDQSTDRPSFHTSIPTVEQLPNTPADGVNDNISGRLDCRSISPDPEQPSSKPPDSFHNRKPTPMSSSNSVLDTLRAPGLLYTAITANPDDNVFLELDITSSLAGSSQGATADDQDSKDWLRSSLICNASSPPEALVVGSNGQSAGHNLASTPPSHAGTVQRHPLPTSTPSRGGVLKRRGRPRKYSNADKFQIKKAENAKHRHQKQSKHRGLLDAVLDSLGVTLVSDTGRIHRHAVLEFAAQHIRWLDRAGKRMEEENCRLKEENECLVKQARKMVEECEELKEENAHMRKENIDLWEQKVFLEEAKPRLEKERNRLREENVRLASENSKLRETNGKLAEGNIWLTERVQMLASAQLGGMDAVGGGYLCQ